MRPEVVLIGVCIILLQNSPDGVRSDLGKVEMLNGSPYVNLQHGIYFGKKISSQRTSTGQPYHYHAFLGIRYASTPKRYEKSVPMSDLGTMSQPYLAQSSGPPCPQLSSDGSSIIGKEDCIVANFFVPANKEPADKDGFPVIVFIHPGYFKSGSGAAFNVSYFMEEGTVICATFNYRLGALGFLSSNDEVLPGNIGLHDQITFLKWVQDNIGDFGGNKKRITVAGVGQGGASSVQFLLLSQRAKGLFQSAIIHGGSMFPSSFIQFQAYPHSKQFSDELECPYKPSSILVECLSIKRLKDILRSQKRVSENYFNFTSPFFPSFEKCNQYPLCLDSFFSQSPVTLLAERQYKRVPVLIGMNSIESMHDHKCMVEEISSRIPVLHPPDLNNQRKRNSSALFESWLLHILEKIPGLGSYQHQWSSSLLVEIQQLYFNEEESEKNEEVMEDKKLQIFLYDVLVRYGIRKFAVTYASDKPVYPYVITLAGRCNSTPPIHHDMERLTRAESGNTIKGPFPDGVEFLTPSLPDYHHFERDSEEEIFSRNLVHLWIKFATHQKPVDVWTNKETWLPLSASQLNGEKPMTWYSLSHNRQVDILLEEPLFRKRMKFWDRLFKQKINAYSL